MGVLDVLRGGASVAAAGFHGYAEDRQASVLAAIKNREVEQQAKRDATNAAIAGRPRRTYDPSRGVLVNEDTASVEQLPGLPEIDRAPVVPPRVPLTTGVGPDGSPIRVEDKPGVKAYVAPKTADKPNLITAPNPVTGVPERVEDKAGVQVPEVSSTAGAAKIRSSVAANRAQMQVIRDAVKELDAYPDAVGGKRALGDIVPALGGVSDYINQRIDEKGVPARAQLSNMGSLVLHDRSGAAVTASEFPRLAPFIPRQGDKASVAKTKLSKLLQNIEEETSFLEKGMVSTPAGGTQPTAGKPAGTTPSPLGSRAAAEAHLKGQGKTPQQILQILGPP